MGTILGCSTKFQITDETSEWVPRDTMYPMDYDEAMNADIGVFFVNLGLDGGSSDQAVVRLLDESKTSSKMLTVKLYRRDGKLSISESTRSTGFFFSSGDQDYERAKYEDVETLQRFEKCVF
jgi:molybdate-binding protein